jgi:prophage regulatory protein
MYTHPPNSISPVFPPHEIYRIQEVRKIVKVGRSTIYLWMKQGKFPPSIKYGPRVVGWTAASVFQWLAEREAAQAT